MDPAQITNTQDDDLNNDINIDEEDLLDQGFSDIDDLSGSDEPDLGFQKGHNTVDDFLDDEDVTGEGIRVGYNDSTEDENDIQNASESNSVFKYMRTEEEVDSKTTMRGDVGQSTLVEDITNPISGSSSNDDDDSTTMVVETDSDTPNEFDYGLRDDADTGDDTTGRLSDNENEDIRGYYDRTDTQTGGPGTHG